MKRSADSYAEVRRDGDMAFSKYYPLACDIIGFPESHDGANIALYSGAAPVQGAPNQAGAETRDLMSSGNWIVSAWKIAKRMGKQDEMLALYDRAYKEGGIKALGAAVLTGDWPYEVRISLGIGPLDQYEHERREFARRSGRPWYDE